MGGEINNAKQGRCIQQPESPNLCKLYLCIVTGNQFT